MNGFISLVPVQAIWWLCGILITALNAVLLYMARLLYEKIMTSWTTAQNDLTIMKNELVKQRTNCLTTLQSQGEQTIQLAQAQTAILERIAESVSFLRGKSD